MKLKHLTFKQLKEMDFSSLSERQLQEVVAEILMRILEERINERRTHDD